MEAIKRFLVVSESEDLLNSTKSLLGQLHHQDVTLVNNGRDALELIDPKKIQFIVLYWEMNTMPGPIFVQKVKEKSAWRHIPILILSEKIKPEEKRLAADLELKNIIISPPEREQFLNKVKTMVEKEESLDPVVRKLRQAAGYIADNELGEAVNILRECSTNADYKATTNTLLGEVSIKKEELNEAESLLDEALKEKSQFTPAKQLLAKVYSKTDRHNEAIELLKSMADYSPLNLSSLLALGAAYYDADELEQAKQTYEKVKELDEDNNDANVGLGSIAFKEGDFALVKEFLEKASDSLDLVRNMNNVAIGLINSNKFDEGINSYDAALEILEGKEFLHLIQYNLGLGYKKKGDYGNALRYLAKAYFSDPTFEKAYAATARLIKEMKEKGENPDKAIVDRIKQQRKSAA